MEIKLYLYQSVFSQTIYTGELSIYSQNCIFFFSFCLFMASACVKNLSLLVSQFYKKDQNLASYHICRIEKCRSRTLASAAGCILCKYNKLHTAFKGSSLQNTYSLNPKTPGGGAAARHRTSVRISSAIFDWVKFSTSKFHDFSLQTVF